MAWLLHPDRPRRAIESARENVAHHLCVEMLPSPTNVEAFHTTNHAPGGREAAEGGDGAPGAILRLVFRSALPPSPANPINFLPTPLACPSPHTLSPLLCFSSEKGEELWRWQ